MGTVPPGEWVRALRVELGSVKRRGNMPGTPALGAVVALGGVTACVGTWLPWLTVASTKTTTISGSGLPVLHYAALGAIALAACTWVAGVRRGEADLEELAGIVALAVAIAAAGLIVLVETVGVSIPKELLPATVRRATVGLGAAGGLWLLGGGAAAMAVACSPGLRGRALGIASGLDRPRARQVSLACLALTLGLLIAIRYQPWVIGTAAHEQVGVDAWLTPWIGPLSLLAVWCVAAALLAGLVGRVVTASLLAAFGGWLATFAAALVIVATDTLAAAPFEKIAPAASSAYAPSFKIAPAAGANFALGLLAAAAGAALIATSPSNRNQRR